MDNMYTPPDDSQDHWATRPLGHASPGETPPASDPRGSRGKRRGRRWGLGIGAAALLLCGGAAAGVALTSATSPAAGPTGQAAVLSGVLSSASSPVTSATTSALTAPQAPQTAAAARCSRAALRLRAAGRPRAAQAVRQVCRQRLLRGLALAGIHGQFTFETKSGPRTLAYERGVVESVSATAVVVRAQDGTTWTWDLVGNTVVRENGQRTVKSALSAGENVFAGGPVSGGTYAARLIVIRKSSGGAAASS
jgi:hypothetical protein